MRLNAPRPKRCPCPLPTYVPFNAPAAVPTEMGPLSTFNVKGLQFTDAECTDPTGETEIVSTGMFGSCSPIYEGGPRFMSGCQREGLLLTQQFSADDTTCSDEARITELFFSGGVG